MHRPRHTRKPGPGENSSLTVQQGVLMAAVFLLCAATIQAAQPGWWTATGGPVNSSHPAQDYAVVNEGQLKQFTQKAVLYLDTNLPDGAGATLDSLVAGWSNYYATNGYTSTNPAPGDLRVVNHGQLKYIASLVYGQLSAEGYTGLYPSWLVANTNAEYKVANQAQLKTVFNFDLSVAPTEVTGLTAVAGTNPGEIDLSWTLPASNDATSLTIERSMDGGLTWTTIGTGIDPTITSYVDLYDSPDPRTYRVTAANPVGSAPPSASPPLTSSPPPVPATPNGFTGYVDNSGTMNLAWTAVTPTGTETISYTVDRQTINSGTWTSPYSASLSSTTFQDGAHGGGGYRYRVNAVATNVTGTTTSATSAEFPAARYAVIDLGANNSADLVNDSGTVVLNSAPLFEGALTQVWSQGTYTAIPSSVGYFGFAGTVISAININGEMAGAYYDYSAHPYGFTCTATGTLTYLDGGVSGPLSQTVVGITSDGEVTGYETSVTGFDGSETIRRGYTLTAAGTEATVGGSITTFNDGITGTTVTSTGSQTTIGPVAMNSSGLIIGQAVTWQLLYYGTDGTTGAPFLGTPLSGQGMIWDGSEHDIAGNPSALNDNGDVLGNMGVTGTLVVWPSGNYTTPVTLLAGPGVAATSPGRAINARTINGVPATQVLANGKLWEMSTTGTFGLPESVADYLPAGAGYSSVAANAINKDGIGIGTASYTSTVGGTTTTTNDAIMLVPVQFSLLNGAQDGADGLNFDGIRPTAISETAPDNTTTEYDIGGSPDTVGSGNDGLDILGNDVPFGQGRPEAANHDYAYSLMVVAKVSPASSTNITYSWSRVFQDRCVTIIKTLDSVTHTYYWEVKSVNKNPNNPTGFPDPFPDTNTSGEDRTTLPSAENLLYYYDDPGMNLHFFKTCGINDYAYEECAFTYTLTITMGSATTTRSFKVGQVTLAQRTGTGTEASSWKGIYNIANTTFIPDCQMPNDSAHVAIIRSIVGGSLPIVIDSHANDPNPNP